MERLTEKHYLAEDHYMKCSEDCNVDMDCVDCTAFDKLIERLAAYEDTGIEPEAVEKVKLALAAKHLVDLETLNNTPISRLVELAEADKAGRCVVLPCNIGDTVWRMKRTFEEYPDRSKPYLEPDWFLLQDVFNIGKTVFLTREEAERAMEDGKDGNKTSL